MTRFFFGITLLFVLLSFGFSQNVHAAEDKGKVVVYNWSEYVPQDVLDDFTKETGIEVVYSTFESNEAMFAKLKLLKGKGYDVVVPSGYFVEPMAKDGLLQKLDHSKLPNMKNLDPQWLNQSFDKGNQYSTPYMLGSVGLAYNTKFIPKGSINKWTDLLRPEFKGKIILSDDLRDIFGLALKATGFSTNEESEPALKKAYEFLRKVKESVRIFDVTAIKQALITEEVWIGSIWNGDFLVAKEENSDLDFFFPEEGAILWMDNFVITKGSENVDNAHAFINFMMRPDIAKRCVDEYRYSTPNLGAQKLLSQEDQENPLLILNMKELKGAEFPAGLGSVISTYEKYWEMLKTTK